MSSTAMLHSGLALTKHCKTALNIAKAEKHAVCLAAYESREHPSEELSCVLRNPRCCSTKRILENKFRHPIPKMASKQQKVELGCRTAAGWHWL